MIKPSGPINRAQAEEDQQARQEAQAKVRAISIWEQDMKQAEIEATRARSLRAQIEATRKNGREDNGERLRELGREHHRLTGAGGGAI